MGAPSGSWSVDADLVGSLSELAASVQRGRTTADVLRIASDGVARLGMRFYAFQLDGGDLVLRCFKTSRARQEAAERLSGRSLVGLRAPLERCGMAATLLQQRKNVYREDLDIFVRLFESSTGQNPLGLDASPATAGISNGVVAPLFVRDRPWGLLSLLSPWFRAEHAPAVALFATHVGSALEVSEFIQALQRTQDELIARERLATIGELAATVAHEVRNPLGVMFNSVASLRRIVAQSIDEPARDDLDVLITILNEETNRLNAIVTDLLEFAKPRAMRTHDTALGELVRDIVSSLPTQNVLADITLELCAEMPLVQVDPRLVRQAVLNLVLNALQAMPEGGSLTLATRVESELSGAYACVDVSDTGEGIAAEDAQRVFEPFFTTKASGTGLGLAVVKRVVEAHQGDLSVRTSPSGTTFTLRLPIERRPSSIPPPPKSEPRLRAWT
jgi:signal transduction histidine kinase